MRAAALLLLLVTGSFADKSDVNFRVDCFPEPGSNKKDCESRGCIYDQLPVNTGPPLAPSCFMPREEMGYTATKVSDAQWKLAKNKVGDLLDLPRGTQSTGEKLRVEVQDKSDPFSFRVLRASKQVIFDTSPGGLVFADKFLQLAVQLPSSNMLGWGENVHPNLKHDFTRYTKWGMFARDEGPDSQGIDNGDPYARTFNTKNLYGGHPFYMAIEDNGAAHGVLILNSNAQDVITVPSNGYIYRTIGGILDIYIFPGPTPAEVIQQYTAFVGRSFLPPYWALGFQLCRYGYKSLDDMKERVAAVRGYQIAFDVAYADIDYMERNKDFTIGQDKWSGFPAYVQILHDWDMHNILIFDPAIEVDYDTFSRAIQKNASFIEWERADEVPHDIQDVYPLAKDTKILLSVVWPDKHVAFPDFLDPQTSTSEWWTDEFRRFHDQIGFDGAWIDMNEPAAFGTNEAHPFYFDKPDHPSHSPVLPQVSNCNGSPDSEWDVPPYKTQAVYFYGKDACLAVKTVCMRPMSVRGSVRQYDVHSLESRATAGAVRSATGKRGVVISRSTFPSSGRFGGHWLGDNTATWEDLRSAVIGVMEFNLFGLPYVGSDVCGFNGVSTEELCLRWQQLGTFHSFYRNHNSDDSPAQDPAVWESVALATKKANAFRYAYLPYLYTLHYKAPLLGVTVIRPLFFDFGSESTTLSISEQFTWGPSILVTPVLRKGATNVTGYIPAGGTFYSLYDNNYGQNVSVGQGVFPAPTSFNAPTFVRAGSILPRQSSPSNTPPVTTVAARKGILDLLIVPSTDGSSTGELYWDDGDTIIDDITNSFTKTSFNYTMTSTTAALTITVERKW